MEKLESDIVFHLVCFDRMHERDIIIIIIIITDLYSAFRSEDTEALDAAQED